MPTCTRDTSLKALRLGRACQREKEIVRPPNTSALWVDAGQMMTTRTSDTQTQTSSQDTQPAWPPHTLSGRTHHSGHVPPVAPPSTPRCQETNNSTTTQTGDRGERVRLEQACSASSNLVAGRKARTRPCVGSCEVSMDALLTGYWPAASPNSHSWVTTVHWMSGCEQRRVC